MKSIYNLTLGDKNQTKPKVVVQGGGATAVPNGRTAIPREVVPTAAPTDTARASVRTCWIYTVNNTILIVGLLIFVKTPLPYVAVHIIQAPGIGLLLPYSVGLAA